MNTDKQLMAEVQQIFENYLLNNKLRRTPERMSILQEIYQSQDHFDADQLYDFLKKNNYHLSRATVYNTLELLTKCGLVIKHQFGQNATIYEKAYGNVQHDHLICLDCGKIFEFCDPRLHQIEKSMGQILKFDIKRHALTLYGHCQGACEKTANNKKNETPNNS